MPQHDSEKKPAKRRITIFRLLVCGSGLVIVGLAVFGLLLHGPLTALLVVSGSGGLVLVCSGALASDETCERITEAITRDLD